MNMCLRRGAAAAVVVLGMGTAGGTAWCADLYVPMPMVEQAPGWTGIYLGGFAGGGAVVTEVTLDKGRKDAAKIDGIGGDGFLGGGFVGYNVQLSDLFVLGVQGDVAVTSFEAEVKADGGGPFLTSLAASLPGDVPDAPAVGGGAAAEDKKRGHGGGLRVTSEVPLLWSISARAGILLNPETMLYAIGGYSNADFSLKVSGSGKTETSLDGYHVGGGIEARITDNLTARAEYRYVDLSEKNVRGLNASYDPDMHIGMIGLAWQLDLM